MTHLPCSRNMRLVRPLLHGFCRRGRRLEESQILVVNYTAAEFSTAAFPAPGATSSQESVLRSPVLKNTPSTGPLAAYRRLVIEGEIREDEHQVTALKVLQELHGSLDGYTPRVQEDQYMGLWSSVLRTVSLAPSLPDSPSRPQSDEETPRGVYMFGGVGTGKTFMMDLFFAEAPVTSKRRVHFFEFMLDVHDRMHNCRKRGISGDLMVATVTDEILQEGWLLCFDEMQVTDIADAMVIRQLFAGLWSRGAVVVATSNRPPDGLYHNGLQRAAFLPFVHQLKERSIVHSLEESRTDYRLSRGTGAATKVFLYPDDEKTLEEFDMIWNSISEGVESVPVTLRVQGREVRVPSAVRGNRVARMTFEELCGSALGSADYVAISEAFHTIFISGVPKMTLIHLNQVRRFITLVDVLYERGVKLVCLAQAPCGELLDPGPGNRADMPDEVFSFGRTASRLTEMQGQEYLRRTWRPTENYLVQFTAEQLSDQELYKIWEAYDVNGDDKMDRDELSFLMEDLCEAKNGHRNVPTDALDMTFEAMDMQKEGYISKKTFMTFGRRFGLFVWWSESSTVTSNGNCL